jgi:hypothetical protein
MMTCAGRRLPAVNSINRNRLNLKLKRETAKAMADASSRTTITAGTRITMVLKKNCGMLPWSQALK